MVKNLPSEKRFRFMRSGWPLALALGFVIGSLCAAAFVGMDEVDDRRAAAGSIGILALALAIIGGAIALFRNLESVRAFAASCFGIFVGVLTFVPLEHVVYEWKRNQAKAAALELRAEVLARIVEGESLPTNSDLAVDSEWKHRFDRLHGDFHLVGVSDRRFEIVVKDPLDGNGRAGVHRLDSRSGDWRFEDAPFAMVRSSR